MKILVLGSTGFIGSALVDRLITNGHEVVGVARVNRLGRLAQYEIVESSLNNVEEYYEHIRSADMVFHLASDTTPSTSIDRPTVEGVNNILPTLSFLEAMQASKAQLVYVSTGGVLYSPDETNCAIETSPLQITSNYAACKIAIEGFIQAYAHTTGNHAVILRPTNVYGPGQYPKRKFGVIPTVFSAILTGKIFELWGSGEVQKNFLYIDDFVELCLCVVKHERTSSLFDVFNAGSEFSSSINQIIELAEFVSKGSVNIRRMSGRGLDAKQIHLSSAKAFETYGWRANTSMETGMNSTWNWIQKVV